MPKDWTGNSNSIYKTLGASNHTDKERETNDYYATEGRAAELLLEVEKFTPTIWENAVGAGDLAKVFVEKGYNVIAHHCLKKTRKKERSRRKMPTKNFSFSDYICFFSDYICIFVTSKIKTDLKNEEISNSAPCFNHTRMQQARRRAHSRESLCHA